MSWPKLIEVALNPEHPQFLQGLDALLTLGLINDDFVRALGRSHLSCPTPDYAAAPPVIEPQILREVQPPEPTLEPNESLVKIVWQRFFEELSVRWLLFLGVFLVVLSSGVLVASQWSNFPAVGQYLVLWSYTCVFGYVGFWASGQQELKLTSQTLQIVAMLLVPLNFWAVDQLQIWQSFGQSLLAIAAIFVLVFGVSIYSAGKHWQKTSLGTFFGLSLFHWGWGNVLSPVVGVYLGILLVIVIFWGLPASKHGVHPLKIPEDADNSLPERVGFEFVLFGLGILLIRVIAIEAVPIGQLGLGLGLLGWLLTELEREKIQHLSPANIAEALAHPWETTGVGLLFLGWLVTVWRYDWQVLGVSLLAIAWLIQKLRRNWQVEELIMLFVVGLQGGILLRNVIPTGVRQSVTTTAIDISHAHDFPYAIYSVTLLPYMLIWAVAALWFDHSGKKELARVSENLLLGLGGILAALSLPNPTWRSLNFSVSAGFWFYFAQYSRSTLRKNYLYLCHGIGLLAVMSIIDWFLPDLGLWAWANITLVALIAEWGFCLLPTTQQKLQAWQRSSWQFGCILGIVSLILLLVAPLNNAPLLRLSGLIVAAMATWVAQQKKRAWRRTAVVFSTFSLIMLPLCGSLITEMSRSSANTFIHADSLRFLQICLAIALGLMVVNVRLVPTKVMTHLHVAFGAALIVSVLMEKVTDWQWLIAGSLMSGMFWAFATVLQPRRRYLGRLYRRICHQWGLVCAGLVALFLLQYSIEQWEYWGYGDWSRSLHLEVIMSGGLLGAVTVWHYWRSPRNEAFVIGGIALEAVLIEAVFLQGEYPLAIAIANLILASLFLGLQRIKSRFDALSVWQAYPLIFTILGVLWRANSFSAYTGLLILFASLLFLAATSIYGNQFFRIVGLVGITWGVYEAVIYQMLQTSGDNIGNALIVLALVGASLAIIYRILYGWITVSKQDTFVGIPSQEILIAAHIHWAIAACLKLLTLPYILPTAPTFRLLAIAVNIFLALYAFIQAYSPQVSQEKKALIWSDWWIYAGCIELMTTGIQARWMWTQLEVLDPYRVLFISVVALFIFQLPWSDLGWRTPPWHRVGIAMPALTLLATTTDVSYLSLASLIIVYLRIAQVQKNIRWTYLSLLFGNWLLAKIFYAFGLVQPLTYALHIGLSILLIAQIDPDLKQKNRRSLRHWIRLLGSGVICIIAFINYQQFGITPIIISFCFVFLGLGTHIRAFLYNGTITLLMTGFYQLIVLIDTYSFSKWIVGLVSGIILISIAANFEKRRQQILNLIQNWLEELMQWQ